MQTNIINHYPTISIISQTPLIVSPNLNNNNNKLNAHVTSAYHQNNINQLNQIHNHYIHQMPPLPYHRNYNATAISASKLNRFNNNNNNNDDVIEQYDYI